MKKLNLFLAMILIMGTAANAQTIDELISKSTAAMGGQSAIDAIKTIRMNISGTYMGQEVEMEETIVKPNKKRSRMHLKGIGIDNINASDGTDYWTSQNGNVKDMSAASIEHFWGGFHQYSATGADKLIGNGTFSYVGKEMVDGINADVVKGLMEGSGAALSIYFDEAGLPFRMLMPSEGGALDMRMTNYRDVAGMLIAYKYEQIVNGKSQMVLEITKVEVNIDIDPSTFERPTQ